MNHLINFLGLVIIFLTLKSLILIKDGQNIIDNLFSLENFSILLILLLVKILVSHFLKEEKENKNIENFAPTDYSMGKYSNLMLKPDSCSDWRKAPACNKLYSKVYVPQGNQLPLKPNFSKPINEGPPVDGNSEEDKRKDMFIFAYNKSSPECCPATYATSTGCICTTKNHSTCLNKG